MTDIDPITGLPKELSSWENIAKEGQQIEVKIEKRKFGKAYTIITGINQHEVDIKDLAKKLKNKFACGGTGKDGVVELQGDHLRKARDELVKLGFQPETIKVSE